MSENAQDSSAQKPKEPKGPVECPCGFFGNPDTGGMCSKCWKAANPGLTAVSSSAPAPGSSDSQSGASSDAGTTSEPAPPPKPVQTDPTRCWSCNKKVGLTAIQCRCGYTFCGIHRYSKSHNCDFDFKNMGRTALATENEKVVGKKLVRIDSL